MTEPATSRQRVWQEAAARSDGMAKTLFSLLALPSETERGHSHREHSTGFMQDGRRGFRCAIDKTVIRWIDPPPPAPERTAE